MRTALLNNPYTDSRMLEIERVSVRSRTPSPARTRVNAVVGAAGGYGLAHQDVWRRRIMRAVQRRARNFVDSNCDELQLESALIESVSQ